MKLTKMDMAKVIVTALYNLSDLVTEKEAVAWKAAKKLVRKNTKEQLEPQYHVAYRVLSEKK